MLLLDVFPAADQARRLIRHPHRALDEPIPLQNVPEGLRLRSVTTTEDGIDARFTGRSVTFRPDSSSAQVSSVEVGEGAPGDLVGVVRR